MPGVAVSATNSATNVVRSTVTNQDGIYSLPGLLPGVYRLSAAFQGFRTLNRDGIELRVDDRISINVLMEVGQQAESVSITAEIPLLRVDDVQAGLVIDNRRIQELPQYNRNPLAFALLVPNVNGTQEQEGHDTDLRMAAAQRRRSILSTAFPSAPATRMTSRLRCLPWKRLAS